MIKPIKTNNNLAPTTHYFADAFAGSDTKGKIFFIKNYMWSNTKFKAEIKYNLHKNLTFIEVEQMNGDYMDVITLGGNPQIDDIKEWLINKW